jgi:heme oxygenase
MRHGSNPRLLLRTATGAAHDRVDAAFGGFDLATRDGYTAFLRAQADAFLPVEAAIDRTIALASDMLDDWPQRRRSDALRADLADLGHEPAAMTAAPAIASREALLGAIYVLEGSRLGGTMLARRVPSGMPRRFLTAADPDRWRKLIQILNRALVTQEQQAAAIAAACDVFARFEEGAQRFGRTLPVE